MEDTDDMAPAVASILSAARDRTAPDRRVDVDARSLPAALAASEEDGRVPVVAEIKPTSPTSDGVRTDDPVALAEAMVDGGAAAISVLTEPEHFDGSPEALRRVREAVDVPVLRKDFLVREAQLDVVAADLVLLIARFLDDLEGMIAAARERGFQPLVEVHTPEEFDRAIDAGARIVGVNNRDLAALEVDLSTFEHVADHARDRGFLSGDRKGDGDGGGDLTLIAESGVTDPEDVRRMRRAGADGLLIGSTIVDGDVAANTERMTSATEREITES